jgi:hypothetical protein
LGGATVPQANPELQRTAPGWGANTPLTNPLSNTVPQAPIVGPYSTAQGNFNKFSQTTYSASGSGGFGALGDVAGKVGNVLGSGGFGALGDVAGKVGNVLGSKAAGYTVPGRAFQTITDPMGSAGDVFSQVTDARNVPIEGNAIKRVPNDYHAQDILGYGLSPLSLATLGTGGGVAGFASNFARNLAITGYSMYAGDVAGSEAVGRTPLGVIPKPVRVGYAQLAAGVGAYEALNAVKPLLPGAAKQAGAAAKAVNAGEAGSVNPSALLDQRLKLRQPALETSPRKGSILSARAAEVFGTPETNPTFNKTLLGEARNLGRQVNNYKITATAQGRIAMRDIQAATRSSVIRDEAGNLYFKGIPQTAEELAKLGPKPGALVQNVLENPTQYSLGERAIGGARKIAQLQADVSAERDMFGASPHRLAMEEGEQWLHRSALKPSTVTQASALVQQGEQGAKRGFLEVLLGGAGNPAKAMEATGGGGSSMGSVAQDATRLFDNPIDAVAAGVVYDHPVNALGQNVERGLNKAATAHLRDLASVVQRTSADYVPDALRTKFDTLKAAVQSQTGRLATAEKRAGLAYGKSGELEKPIDKLSSLMPSAEAKVALKTAVQEMNSARTDALRTARAAGSGLELDRAAQNAFQGKLDSVVADLASRSTAQEGEIRYALLKNLEGTAVQGAQENAVSAYIKRAAQEIEAKGAAGALKEADAATVVAAKNVAPEDVYTALRQMQRRADALSARGSQWAGLADSIQHRLSQTQAQFDALLPEWRKAQEVAADRVGNAAGRAKVQGATAFMGKDYPKATASALTHFFDLNARLPEGSQIGKVQRDIRSVNSNLTSAKATLDASGTFLQNHLTYVLHPDLFAKNIGASVRDSFNPAEYDKWLASPVAQRAQRRGTALLGPNGANSDYEFTSWFTRLPVVGKAAERANVYFESLNSRMRADLTDAIIDMNKRGGMAMDARAEEQVAAAVNRMTGAATTRAGDLETLGFFASNFQRAIFETMGKAFTDKGLEGQIARRYLGTYFTTMGMATAGIAAAQGRDMGEVLNPIDMKALKNGELKMNPNFGTARVEGQDVSLLGPYRTYARLAAVAANSANKAIKDHDMMALLDAIGQVEQSKGSPVGRKVTEIARDETFSGYNPRSAAPEDAWQAAVDAAIPISIASAVLNRAKGMSWHDAILDGIANSLGLNSNPMTATERLDQKAGGDFASLSKTAQDDLLAANPYIANLRDQQASGEGKRAQEVTAKITGQQQNADKQFAQDQDGKTWSDNFHANQTELRIRKDEIYHALNLTAGKDPVLDKYFAALDAANPGTGGPPDWTKVDAYIATLHPADVKHIGDKTGLSLDTPTVREYRAATKALLPYWDIQDGVWNKLRSAGAPTGMQDFGTWYDQQLRDLTRMITQAGAPPEAARYLAAQEIAKMPLVKDLNAMTDALRIQWAMTHLGELRAGVKWGHITPNKDIQALLRGPR